MEFFFPTDADGFLSQECPSCGSNFKILLGEGSDKPISHCPYCGHHGSDCWLTRKQAEVIEAMALNDAMRDVERQLRGMAKGILKFNVKPSLKEPPPIPIETDDPFDILRFACCDETVKIRRSSHHYCIICGSEINMGVSDSKKVFLSHKGVDKGTVKDFMQTLSILGYVPWIDEEAMPAGTPLERGILRGMQESCGVVFFITPSFKDEGYLESEINYAVAEKREKGDKFAIITLLLQDSNGQTGEVPALLKPYVWKVPKSLLEALREIVRALPVAPGIVDWRDGLTGVATLPKTRSTVTQLSDEAILILKAATANGGRICHLRTLRSGAEISAGNKSMIPERADSQTRALWIGGLEDLIRRRFIVDRGHKGEVFEVTREGYLAAAESPDRSISNS